MDDAEFVFHETNRERKVIGYGDKHKVRRGGKTVRLGHDYMTPAQLRKMNGEMKVYEMNKPCKYNVFKFWPDDLKKEYLSGLFEKYDVSHKDIAEMLEVSPATVYRITKTLGIASAHTGYHVRSFENEKAWREFLNPAQEKDEEKDTLEAETDAVKVNVTEVVKVHDDTSYANAGKMIVPEQLVFKPSDYWAVSSSISYISGMAFDMPETLRDEIVKHLQIIEQAIKPYSPFEGF